MSSLYRDIPRPFFVLAPMEDVTDTVFRTLIRRWSLAWGSPGPAIMYSEFTRVDGAVRAWQMEAARRIDESQQTEATRPTAGSPERYDRLVYTDFERPMVAQLWGTRPEEFYAAAQAVERLGFDGIDINMGCPARKIRKVGACSALIGRHDVAAEIIAACRAGSSLPLSVKTRIGLDRVVTEEWVDFLLELNIDALTIHGRIADQLSEGAAEWSEVAKAVNLRDERLRRGGHDTAIIGNGDVYSIDQGLRRVEETRVDGIMIGRGVFYDPLIFARRSVSTAARSAARGSQDGGEPPEWTEIPLIRRLAYLREQINAFTARWGDRRNYEVLKKFFRNYLCVYPDGPPDGLPAAPEDPEATRLLFALYDTHNAAEASAILDAYPGRPV